LGYLTYHAKGLIKVNDTCAWTPNNEHFEFLGNLATSNPAIQDIVSWAIYLATSNPGKQVRTPPQLKLCLGNNNQATDCTALLLTFSARARCNVLFYDAVNMRRARGYQGYTVQ
jgi:hypothetical protein